MFSTLFGRWQQRCGLSLSVLRQLVLLCHGEHKYRTLRNEARLFPWKPRVIISPPLVGVHASSELLRSACLSVCLCLFAYLRKHFSVSVSVHFADRAGAPRQEFLHWQVSMMMLRLALQYVMYFRLRGWRQGRFSRNETRTGRLLKLTHHEASRIRYSREYALCAFTVFQRTRTFATVRGDMSPRGGVWCLPLLCCCFCIVLELLCL